jgi:stage III sporulation protein AG
MDIKKLKKLIPATLEKYKYAALVLAAGLVLMLLPSVQGSREVTIKPETEVHVSVSVQDQLQEILSYIDGAGAVKVLLTESTGAETVYQCDEEITSSDSAKTKRLEVVTVTDADRNESGLVRQVNPSKYLGAIILCQGADDPTLKLKISHAVSKVTGLGADKIAVLKMK